MNINYLAAVIALRSENIFKIGSAFATEFLLFFSLSALNARWLRSISLVTDQTNLIGIGEFRRLSYS